MSTRGRRKRDRRRAAASAAGKSSVHRISPQTARSAPSQRPALSPSLTIRPAPDWRLPGRRRSPGRRGQGRRSTAGAGPGCPPLTETAPAAVSRWPGLPCPQRHDTGIVATASATSTRSSEGTGPPRAGGIPGGGRRRPNGPSTAPATAGDTARWRLHRTQSRGRGPARPIPVGLYQFYDWYRPYSSGYQHGFSTRSGNDGKQPGRFGQTQHKKGPAHSRVERPAFPGQR